LPGIEGFNHAIVYVPGEKPMWIDPASEFTPASRLPFVDQGRWALVGRATTTQLIRTPESQAGDNVTKYAITIRLQPEGEGTYELTEEQTGAFEELLRPLAALSPDHYREQKSVALKIRCGAHRRIARLGGRVAVGRRFRISEFAGAG